MDKIKLCLNNDKKYVVACSFGPDSMALLDAAIKEKLNIVVAHVNYRKREAANYEQKALTDYCNERNIKIYVLDLLGVKPIGNFQQWARIKRYEFFKTVAEKENSEAVLVAHNEDDVIETYLMQKNRGIFAKNYGISRENELFGVKIIRPLLKFSKQYLQSYDDENGVPYSIDETNLSDHYTRNKIRHTIVQKLSKEQRKIIINEIQLAAHEKIENKRVYSLTEFKNLNYTQILMLLDSLMQKVNEHRDLSEKFVVEIKKAFETKTNHRVEITKSVWIELDYGDVYLVNAGKIKKYQDNFESTYKNDFIDIDFSGGAEDRNIPLLSGKHVIKNCQKNDKVIIKYYSSTIHRLFIDWKMPLFLREVWPGVYDENGCLLYVPRYRKNFKDEHKSKFKIDTNYFLDF